MTKQQEVSQLTQSGTTLMKYQEQFLLMLDQAGLPREGVFVSVEERIRVLTNAGTLLEKMDDETRASAIYISKFFAAVSAGLFDAALNYIWDETVLHLRKRIEAYDLEYFYEIAASEEKRKELKSIEDIIKLTDDELLRGARGIDLITEAGFRSIDLVKYMRNNASAAHPNQLEITGIKLLSMAEDCLREVISTPIPPAAVAVQQLLSNIKTTLISPDDAREISAHFSDMGPDRTQRLARGIFGIFSKRDTPESVRQNIRLIAPMLWPFVDTETRKSFGIKHAFFAANNHVAEKTYAREFLTVVDGLQYVTDQIRVVEVISVLDQLLEAHNGFNNFYNEILPAKKLRSVLGNPAKVPAGAETRYITTLIDAFLSNGYGVATAANEIYTNLISELNSKQATFAMLQIFNENVSSKLRLTLCATKYLELLDLVGAKISTTAAKELLNEILSEKYPLSEVKRNQNLSELGAVVHREIAL